MKTLHDPLRVQVAEAIQKALASAYPEIAPQLSLSDLYEGLGEPPNSEMGDFAFGCFPITKLAKVPPPVVAKQLQEKLETGEAILSAKAAGPYLNITLQLKSLGQSVLQPILDQSMFQKTLTQKNPRTMIEYSQPNTHKEIHVGHMRNLCLGDAIVRMQKYIGYEILTATFPGDMGTHVAKCLWYMKLHNTEPIPDKDKGEWLGRMYSKGHLKLEDEENTPQGPKNKAELTAILQQLEEKRGEYHELWKETREWSIDLMKQVYKWADVEFDHWYWESEVDSASVAFVKEQYEKGKLIKSEGAIGIDLEPYGLGFCMLLKSDGTGLYAAKDLELARRKFEQVQIEKSIYVVDIRQALHFKQVFKTLELLGFEQAKSCFHLQYNFVELPDGAMSSRKGNIVPLFDLIHQMEEMIKTLYLKRYESEWSQIDINRTASMIAKGAIRYGMLKMDTNKKIVFDMAEWLKLDGESGPFIQYSYARIASLAVKQGFDPKAEVNYSVLSHKSERQILQHLMHFNTVIVTAAENYKPISLCSYLYDLAKKFNTFYHDCPIGNAGSEELKAARLALAVATGKTLKQGLSLLGIPAPEKM